VVVGSLSGLSLLSLLLVAQAAPGAEETPAEPSYRATPEYPTACKPAPGVDIEPQKVVVLFDVNARGDTERVRVTDATDACFEPTAVAAVRMWKYSPRRVDGHAESQEDLETTLTFLLTEETQLTDYDARPLHRVAPAYPANCMEMARDSERVLVEFDVTPEGRPENVQILDSTYICLNKATKTAVEQWEYKPKIDEGQPVMRRGVQTVIVFSKGNNPTSKLNMRKNFFRDVKEIENLLQEDKITAAQALERLSALEGAFGDTFSMGELNAFHQVRAVAYARAGELAKALDDFQIAKTTTGNKDSIDAIDEVIARLETALAAQDRQAAASDLQQEPR